ncbi:MAG TPA: PorV/PorQ family protein [Elusimicrobiales bacterium]|nr:PorV/PorQ family protein [Elusimicrobiales bacterium]HOL62296.1 PorV/PorQ family protein [Elusimicrobiales bacterium]HPO95709.1 PorV/PorQ family protein [Elusimicrobiales bacterium]
MKKTLTLISIFISLNANSAFDSSSYGTTAASILKLNINPRCVSMGEACTSDISDASAIDINPANLVKIPKNSLFLSHNIFFENITLESLSFAANLGKNTGTFGIGVKYLNWGKIEKTDDYANDMGSFSPNEMVVELGFASYLTGLTKDPEERIVFGGIGKFIQNKIEKSATTLSADIGILFPYMFDRKLALSLVFQNIVGSIKMDQENYDITKIIRLGSSVFITRNMTINSDIIMPQDRFLYWSIGFEERIKINKRTQFSLRAGANTRNISDMEGLRSVSFGFGIKHWDYLFDYSFSPFGNLGNIHRISLTINY